MSTVIVLYGPKGAGKTEIARRLEAETGVYHVDPDPLIQALIDAGRQPHPTEGWLADVLEGCFHALERHDAISVEATGAWESDWQLARDIVAQGHRVVRVWVYAPLAVTLRRLQGRRNRVPVPREEARRIHDLAVARAVDAPFDVLIDTTSEATSEDALRRIVGLCAKPT